jgi:predicted AAA+ superfamily ATPase
VLLLGARQVGKTTLARLHFPHLPYCDLESPALRQLFTEDPAFQIQKRSEHGLILDEAQAVPAVFSALRGIIDQRRSRRGKFLILGSAQPALVRRVSESLAGRVGILELDPLTAHEARSGSEPQPWEQVWLQGGFPDALRGSFREWWEAYLRTYIERDLPHPGLGAEPLLLRRLLMMLAHLQGSLLNASQLGQSLGVSYHTVQQYLDILEHTFIIRRLHPYFRYIGKRLTKSPKVYLRDTGLLHHLLNINTLDELDNHPARSASWETFVIEDLWRREKLSHPHSQCFFWRTASGDEIDLLLVRGSKPLAIEVKAGRGDKAHTARHLTRAIVDTGSASAWVIDESSGAEPLLLPRIERRGFADSLDWLPG